MFGSLASSENFSSERVTSSHKHNVLFLFYLGETDAQRWIFLAFQKGPYGDDRKTRTKNVTLYVLI